MPNFNFENLTDNERHLKELLENISDTYADFVKIEVYCAKEYGYSGKMIEYIESSSTELTSSDIIEKSCEFRGI